MRYDFQFIGGSKEVSGRDGTQAIIKFHLYVTDKTGAETHFYQAQKNGTVEKSATTSADGSWVYRSIYPVVKIFTSTRGFGIPQEYFSYFFLLNPKAQKMVNVKPLGYEKVGNWYFQAAGRFLTGDEIKRLYGRNSNTYKFYSRQTHLSKLRIQQHVTVSDRDISDPTAAVPVEVRRIKL